jgi:CubicO group peptidase (beta-lactamase class C family)
MATVLRRAALIHLIAVTWAGAQAAPADSAGKWVDSIFAPFASTASPGCAVGVTRGGQLQLERDYGMASLAEHRRIAPDTRFYLASLSKQFTAMSVVLLSQDGKLSLDDDVRRWVPEVPSFGAAITIRQLLSHTSGLRDYLTLLSLAGWPGDGTLTEQQFLDLIARQRGLNFPAGDQFLYSNTGYALLSIVVKRASGQSLRDFAAARIFQPLGMTHTEFRDDHTARIPARALGYEPGARSGGKGTAGYRVSEPQFDVVGDGGMYSTVEDLAKWDANFDTGQVGGVAGVALLAQPGTAGTAGRVPYALGLTVGTFQGLRTLSHGGAYGGYRTAFLRFPDQHLSVITLCNTSAAPTTLAQQVATVFLGQAMTRGVTMLDLQPDTVQAARVFGKAESGSGPDDQRRRADEMSRIPGAYYSADLDMTVTLLVSDGAVVMRRPKATDIRFSAFSGDLFTNGERMLLFVLRDDGGAVTGFTLTAGRVRDLPFTRKDAKPGSDR